MQRSMQSALGCVISFRQSGLSGPTCRWAWTQTFVPNCA